MYHIIAADVKALDDCWLVGDEFLKTIHRNLQDWKSDNAVDNLPTPFLYSAYNIMAWYKSSLPQQPHIAHMLNAFLEAMNASPKLPKYIIIIPDSDIIKGTRHLDFGVVCMLEEQVKWLMAQIFKYILRRCDDLQNKRPGALPNSEYPRIFWVLMMKRPWASNIHDKKVMGLRSRTNNIVARLASSEHSLETWSVDVGEGLQMFNHAGELTSQGQREFWKEINSCLKAFDWHQSDNMHTPQLPYSSGIQPSNETLRCNHQGRRPEGRRQQPTWQHNEDRHHPHHR